MSTIQLNSGNSIPIIGLGTWQSNPGEVAAAVKLAVAAGYRHIDCAYLYQNQKEIGEALKEIFAEGKVKREDLFITSKVWNTFHSTPRALENIDIILKDLQLSYVDLMLIHFPQGYEEVDEIFPTGKNGEPKFSNIDYLDTWKALEQAVQTGKAKSIGISNFNHKQIERIWENSKIKPAVLQIELNPYLTQTKLRAYCKQKGIVVVGYSPLGSPGSKMFRKEGDPTILTDKVITDIAKAHGKTPAQIVLRWFIESGLLAIPKSVSAHRLAENFALFDFQLSPEEVKKIDGLNQNFRILDLSERDGTHPYYPFSEEY